MTECTPPNPEPASNKGNFPQRSWCRGSTGHPEHGGTGAVGIWGAGIFPFYCLPSSSAKSFFSRGCDFASRNPLLPSPNNGPSWSPSNCGCHITFDNGASFVAWFPSLPGCLLCFFKWQLSEISPNEQLLCGVVLFVLSVRAERA